MQLFWRHFNEDGWTQNSPPYEARLALAVQIVRRGLEHGEALRHLTLDRAHSGERPLQIMGRGLVAASRPRRVATRTPDERGLTRRYV